jgi:hypothetical protein
MTVSKLPNTFEVNPTAGRPHGPAALIVVGTEWCGHCKQFKPELNSWKFGSGTKVYWADGDSDPRTKNWKIDGYPTILYKPSTGGLFKYTGSRDLPGVKRFIASLEN